MPNKHLSSVPASAEQIAKIKSLQSDIQNLVKQVNRPYSMVISIAFFSTIIDSLFFNQNSPFYGVYQYLDQLALDISYSKNEEYYQGYKNYDSFMNFIDTTLNTIIETEIRPLFRAIATLDKRYSFLLNLNFREMIEYFETIDSSNEVFAPFRRMMNQVYKKLIPDADVSILQNLKPTEIMQRMEIDHRKMSSMSALTYLHRVRSTKEIAVVVLSHTLKIGLIATGHKLIIEKTLNHFFPNGIFQDPIPTHNTLFISHSAAQTLIGDLEDHTLQLKQTSRSHVIFARYLCIPLLLFGAYLFYSQNHLELLVMAFVTVAIAVTNLSTDLYEAYENYTRNSFLEKQRNKIETLLSKTPISIEPNNNSEYFILSCGPYQKYNLPAKEIYRLMKTCLLFHKVDILANKKKRIFISTDVALTTIVANNVNTMFQNSAKRLFEINHLLKQITKLEQRLDITAEKIPANDSQGLPTENIELHLPQNLGEVFFAKFKEVFGANNEFQIKKMDESNLMLIHISGFTPVNETGFKQLLDLLTTKKLIKQSPQQLDASNWSFFSPTNSRQYPKSSGKKNTAANQKVAPKNLNPNDNNRRVIDWGKKGTFDSEAEHNNINPVRRHGTTIDRKYLQQCNNFTLFNLPVTLFPTQEHHDTMQDASNNAMFGKTFVYWSGMMEDHERNRFWISAKVRVKGADGKGNNRGYYEATQSATGETLHELRAVEFEH